MTSQETALRELMAKGSDAGPICEMVAFAAERLTEPEVGAATGVTHDERSPGRLMQRDGCRERDGEARAGTVERVSALCSPRGCGRGHTSQPSFNPVGRPRRR